MKLSKFELLFGHEGVVLENKYEPFQLRGFLLCLILALSPKESPGVRSPAGSSPATFRKIAAAAAVIHRLTLRVFLGLSAAAHE
jgi:hypothetical protein